MTSQAQTQRLSASRYTPINCEFHDHLEVAALHKRRVLVKFVDETSRTVQQCDSKILEIGAQDGIEYLIFESQLRIRLDQLISIDQLQLAAFT